MNNRSILVLSLVIWSFSCVEIATFPDNGSRSITQPEQYFSLIEHRADYKGETLRMAGRMVGIEKQEQGFLIIAELMLFPKNPNLRPEFPQTDKQDTPGRNRQRFLVYYSEPIAADFLWNGNEFLVFGQFSGTKSLVNMVGASYAVPHIAARCLHVWQTGSADLKEFTDQPALGFPYFPPLERTFCLGIPP